MVGKSKSTAKKEAPSVEEIAAAVAMCLDEKMKGLQSTVEDLALKLEGTTATLGSLEQRVNQISDASAATEGKGDGWDIVTIRTDMNEALKYVAAEIKDSVDKTLQGCSKGSVNSADSILTTTAEIDPDPYVTIRLEGSDLPIYFPRSVREGLAVEKSQRAIARIVLRHFHKVNEIRTFTLKSTGDEEDDDVVFDDDNDEGRLKLLPAKTMLTITAVVLKKFPVSPILLQHDPESYAATLKDKKTAIRGHVSRLLQYFRSFYDDSGNMKEEKRYANRKSGESPDGSGPKSRRISSSPK